MKIVILGGCGYIGSELFTYLQNKKYSVDTVDLEWFGNYVNPKNIKRDYKDLSKKFFDTYDAVILLAGHSTVGMCEKDIVGSLKNNVENFAALTKKMKKQKFIYASTYRVYSGSRKSCPKETDTLLSPPSTYDITKQTIDSLAWISALEFYGLRFATVNGYSPNLRVNQIINKLFLETGRRDKINVYNPESSFSVLDIHDLCRAIEQILLGKDKRGIYNLGSYDTNINSIMKELSKIFAKVDFSVQKSLNKPNHICFDVTKFQKEYGFKFKNTLRTTILTLTNNFSNRSHTLKSL
jgi:UDP-glucose 4-epimerase